MGESHAPRAQPKNDMPVGVLEVPPRAVTRTKVYGYPEHEHIRTRPEVLDEQGKTLVKQRNTAP